MRRLPRAAATAALVAAFLMPEAWAQPACTDRSRVVQQLGQKYHEVPVALGVANNGGVIELFQTPEIGGPDGRRTWTLVITMPGGLACMMAAGEDWQAIGVAVREGSPT